MNPKTNFASFVTEKNWIEEMNKINSSLADYTSEQIVEFSDYVNDNIGDFTRICSATGELMTKGYCIGGGEYYFKSYEHLLASGVLGATKEEVDEVLRASNSDDPEDGDQEVAYYTEWY